MVCGWFCYRRKPRFSSVEAVLSDGLIGENPIRETVAAVSAGVVGGVPLLDLDYPEDSGCDSDVNLVMTDNGGIVEIQGTAEGATFDSSELAQLLALGRQSIVELCAVQAAAFDAWRAAKAA